MIMSEKCHNNNNSVNPLTSRRTDGGKNELSSRYFVPESERQYEKREMMTKIQQCLFFLIVGHYFILIQIRKNRGSFFKKFPLHSGL